MRVHPPSDPGPATGGLARFLAAEEAVASVRVVRVRGSAPREAGAEMFVAPGRAHGTIGGGRLERMAIEAARGLLRGGEASAAMDVPLGPEIGQCCGGRVELALARMTPEARAAAVAAEAEALRARPRVLVLGAGHVGRALAACLSLLPVRAVLIDSRAEELARAPAGVEVRLTPLPEAEVAAAPRGSAFVVLTHDHALDFLLAAEALERGDARYVGLIGSATKRARFERHCAERSPPVPTHALTCPIGAGGGADKRPEVIAAFVAAEIMARLAVEAPAA